MRNESDWVGVLEAKALEGLRVLIVEDEYLIAMDLDELCRENGARDVRVVGNLDELGARAAESMDFDVALLDVMVGGAPTLEFARSLLLAGIPFVFTTAYSERDEIFREFPSVAVLAKPYLSSDVIEAVKAAAALSRG